jgi:YD repeat-containing protein
VTARNSYTGSQVAYSFVYGAAPYLGRLTSTVDSERTIRFTYDAVGRLSSEIIQENGISQPLVTSYLYDADGAVSQVTYPSGLAVRYVRDPATREVTRAENVATGQAYASQVTHAPGGPVEGLTFGNGLSLAKIFNRRYEPASIASGPLQLGYHVTPAGDVAAIDDGSGTLSGCSRNTSRSFEYDFLDRLVASPGWSREGRCRGRGGAGHGPRLRSRGPVIACGEGPPLFGLDVRALAGTVA